MTQRGLKPFLCLGVFVGAFGCRAEQVCGLPEFDKREEVGHRDGDLFGFWHG